MNWFLSLLVGVLTAAIGCVSVGFLATLNVRWYRISSFEGGAGYYVVFLALLGAVVGLIVGIVCARISAGWVEPGFLKGFALAAGSMLGLVVSAGVICRLAADIVPTIDGKSLQLTIEVKAPAGFQLPVAVDEYGAHAAVYLLRAQAQPHGELNVSAPQQRDGRWIFAASVPLQTSARKKYLRVYFNKEHDPLFPLPLRGYPNRDDLAWSEWIEAAWNVGTERPAAEAAFFMRYRVEVIEPPPPGPTQAEVDAQRAAEEEAAFQAVPHDAPLTTWLPYTRYGTPEARLRVAIARIEARERFEHELGEIITGDDHESAAAGLWMIQHLEVFRPELNTKVAAAGRKIAEVIRAFNASTPEQDPGLQGAADASVRFHSWMEAVRTLRAKNAGDFTPELHEILQLSRVRDDSHAMRADIRRVASYYMKTWAGVEPVPGDPPPR